MVGDETRVIPQVQRLSQRQQEEHRRLAAERDAEAAGLKAALRAAEQPPRRRWPQPRRQFGASSSGLVCGFRDSSVFFEWVLLI